MDRRATVWQRHAHFPHSDDEELPRVLAALDREDGNTGGESQAEDTEDEVELAVLDAPGGPEGASCGPKAGNGVVGEDVRREPPDCAIGKTIASHLFNERGALLGRGQVHCDGGQLQREASDMSRNQRLRSRVRACESKFSWV